MIPRATYRLQFGKGFGFADAANLASYLAELGISHAYASPYLRARPGSAHGYDIIDHNALNPELGGDAAFQRMLNAFQEHGLKQILDYVPNHMGVGGADNPLWLDVLEFGRDSRYAEWFDIDWDPYSGYLEGKLLVPFLGEQYGLVLQEGQIELRYDPLGGEFSVWLYGSHKLPVAPRTYGQILEGDDEELAKLALKFDTLPSAGSALWERVEELKKELTDLVRAKGAIARKVESALSKFRGVVGDLQSWHALESLIQKQNWRPTHFRVAADDINYRRFFNINELAGIRMELPEVFEHSHRLVLALVRSGALDGLRIDHVDGLYDPKEYLSRLRQNAGGDFYLVVEKILQSHEELRPKWPVAGTTGYEFCSALTGLFVDAAAQPTLTRFYQEFTGEHDTFPEVVRQAKRTILENEMAGDLESLSRAAVRIARQDPTTQDFTQNILRRALKEILACFPVYRTYVDRDGATETDKRYICWAIAQARKNEQQLDPSVFDFLQALLLGQSGPAYSPNLRPEWLAGFAQKAQQLSGPVMAKGVEDTAFYRYNCFVALNEVGSSPEEFGVSIAAFHQHNQERAKHWPSAISASSTHDTKRGEDARARLAALSLIPNEWITRVNVWSRLLRARRGDVERTGPPAPSDEYLLYQNLVASWPPALTSAGCLDPCILRDYTERLAQATTKSLREARLRSNWVAPDSAYEEAVLQFIRDALNPGISTAFLENFLEFQQGVTRMGFHNSIVQLVLKATSPGVPDFYQGCELWNLSLMDPDNRRPIDFDLRRELLRRSQREDREAGPAYLRQLLDQAGDGRIKLLLTRALLKFRQEHYVLFEQGSYEPLTVEDDNNSRICAFWRRTESQRCLTIGSLDARRSGGDWGDTAIHLDSSPASEHWQDVLSQQRFWLRGGGLRLADVLDVLPTAVLIPCGAE
jgi:(1->4)-alpha-D-glucan 1-alpha-D-glucosylmutase